MVNKYLNPLTNIYQWYLDKRQKFYHCDIVEFIDRPSFPTKDKLKIIQGLDIKNKTFGTYKKIYSAIKPLILKVNKEEKRPFKILELAGGLGDLSIGLYQVALKDKQSPLIKITHSDIVDEYIEITREKISSKNFPIKSKRIDALDLDEDTDEHWDLIITLHSLHHFNQHQLDLLFKRSLDIAKFGIFAVDGAQNFGNTFFMFITAFFPSLFTLNHMYIHDALVSARKMYGLKTLQLIGEKACPNKNVEAKKLSLGLYSLTISPKG